MSISTLKFWRLVILNWLNLLHCKLSRFTTVFLYCFIRVTFSLFCQFFMLTYFLAFLGSHAYIWGSVNTLLIWLWVSQWTTPTIHNWTILMLIPMKNLRSLSNFINHSVQFANSILLFHLLHLVYYKFPFWIVCCI